MNLKNNSKKKCPEIQKFYRSNAWQRSRQIKITKANGRCEVCGNIGTEVHHIKHLTVRNVTDPEVSINQKNLMLLCNECHNKKHGRFIDRKT